MKQKVKSFIFPVNTFVFGVLVLGAILIVCFPLLHKGFFVTDDGSWLLIRLTAFYQTLTQGQFPVRFVNRLNFNYGYPVSNFAYPGYLYIGSFLHLVGVGFIESFKVIMALSVGALGVGTYLWLAKRFGVMERLVGTCLAILSPYVLFDLYSRGSIGELVALGSAAILLWAIDDDRYGIVPPATFFLLIGHNILAVFFFFFFSFLIIFTHKWRMIQPFVIGLLASSFFWIPALLESRFTTFNLTNVSNPHAYYDQSLELILVNALPLVVLIYLIFQKTITKSRFVLFHGIVFLASIFFASSLSRFFWNSTLVSHVFQFPFRFLSLSVLSGIGIVVWALSQMDAQYKKIVGVMMVLLTMALSWPFINFVKYVDYGEGYYTTNEATTTISNEYMPLWASKVPTQRSYERLIFISGSGKIDLDTSSKKPLDARVTTNQDSVMQFNTLYYPGWGIIVNDKAIPIEVKNEYGLMQFTLPKGDHHITASFRETPSRFGADLLTVVAGVWYVVYFIAQRRKRT